MKILTSLALTSFCLCTHAGAAERPVLVAVPTANAGPHDAVVKRELALDLGSAAVIHAVRMVPGDWGGCGRWVQIWTNASGAHAVASWARAKFRTPPQIIHHVAQDAGPFGTPFTVVHRVIAHGRPADPAERVRLESLARDLDRVHRTLDDPAAADWFARSFADVVATLLAPSVGCGAHFVDESDAPR